MWRRIKHAFVDGTIGKARAAATTALALRQIQAGSRPAALPIFPLAPESLMRWGVVIGDRIAGSGESIAALLSQHETPSSIHTQKHVVSSSNSLNALHTELMEVCDVRDWEACRGAWFIPNSNDKVTPTDSQVEGSSAPTLSYELEPVFDEEEACRITSSLSTELLKNNLQVLGPSLNFSSHLRIVASPPHSSGASHLPAWAGFSRMNVAVRLCERMRLSYISPLSVLLCGVHVFDAENRRLFDESSGISIPDLASLPTSSLAQHSSIADAMKHTFEKSNALALQTSLFSFQSDSEREESFDILYELGAYVAAHISAFQRAVLRMCGVDSAEGGPASSATKSVSASSSAPAKGVQFDLDPQPPIECLDGCWTLSPEELIVCDMAVTHGEVDRAARSLCAARLAVRDAIAAARSGKGAKRASSESGT